MRLERRSEVGDIRQERWLIDASDGEQIHFDLATPSNYWGAVLIGHGFNSSAEADYVTGAAQEWSRHGLGVAAIDFPLHGRRGGRELDWVQVASLEYYEQCRSDLHLALDTLADRVPGAPLGYLGFSMGGLIGPAVVSGRSDVEALCLAVTGSTAVMLAEQQPDWFQMVRGLVDSTDPVGFARRIEHVPVLMLNAREDDVFSVASARALFEAFNQPKTQVFFDGSHGEWAAPETAYGQMFDFFREHLTGAA